MLKLAIGFVAFAALAIVVLMSTDGNIDLTGEKHGLHGPGAIERLA